ncbi:MAG: NPCBM/NEW2 domain-containing protein [Phycisphaerae bacterium]
MKHALMFGFALLLAAAAPAGERVSAIDARIFDGSKVVVTADKVEITLEGGKKESLPRGDVAEIVLAKADNPLARKGQAVLLTVGGGQLAVGSVALAGSKLTFANTLLGATEIPLDGASAIFTPDEKATPQQVMQRCAELKYGNAQRDMLVIAKAETDWLPAEGVIKAIGDQDITFTFGDSDRLVPRKTVRAVYMAAMGAPKSAAAGTITGVDGSSVPFASLTMDDKSLDVDIPGIGKKKLNRADVASIRFTSERVVDLADLKPAEVKEHGLFDRAFPHRLNRSAGGKEIKLGGETFATGLGLHSFCELTYDLGGAYATFVAVVGIDDAVRPSGDATVTFLGDGKDLQTADGGQQKSIQVTGKDKPQLVRLKLAGVKKFTIRVDFGADGVDVADHVDLGAARLIK